jgi:hypothetical protein
MGYQQLFLVLASVVLLTLLMVQINSNAVEGREALQQLELEQTAVGIAQQFIEEAKSKNFDELIGVIPPASMPGGFTPANALGPGSDTYPQFNDVDDYNNLARTVYINGVDFDAGATDGIPFTVGIKVNYVTDANPDSAVSAPTFLKRMTVKVASTWIPDTVVVKHVFSYYGVNL